MLETVLRTPEERFTNLPGYPFEPHYLLVDGLRMHYVDEGASHAEPVLMLHGEPSWSYLYRKMIPIFAAAGLRAVAPDLIGFGRSDKPADRAAYTYQRHVDWMHEFIRALDLKDITLVCQDWGGFIGLRVAAEQPDRFARIVVTNSFLPTGDYPPGDGFFWWRNYSQEMPEFDAGGVAQMMTATVLPPEVVARTLRRSPMSGMLRARASSPCSCRSARMTRPPRRIAPRGGRWSDSTSHS